MSSSAPAGALDALQQAREWLLARGAVADPEQVTSSEVGEVPNRTSEDRLSLTPSGAVRAARGQPPAETGTSLTRRPPGKRRSDPEVEDETEFGSNADPESVARAIVLRKLAARDRTRSELAVELSRRLTPADVAERVLDRFVEAGLVDDTAFAERWVESRQQRRHLSRTALRRELRAKGLDAGQIEAALAGVASEEEFSAALSLAQKKAASMSGLDRDVRYRRLAAALGRREFSAAVIAQVLADVLGDGGMPGL
jgi:regulatory protein